MPAPSAAAPPAGPELDARRLLRLRVWAADVRDGGGPAAAHARTLCALLDARAGVQADNARAALDGSVALLVGLMVLAGAAAPGHCTL